MKENETMKYVEKCLYELSYYFSKEMREEEKKTAGACRRDKKRGGEKRRACNNRNCADKYKMHEKMLRRDKRHY